MDKKQIHGKNTGNEKTALEDRINSLKEYLKEKRDEFDLISKEYFRINQDFASRKAHLKALKSQSSELTKSYVEAVALTAKSQSDFEYKRDVLHSKSDFASDLINDSQLSLQQLQEGLENAVRNYMDCRKGLKKYQSIISNVTDEARIEALNMVAYCRYAQSIIVNEVKKLPKDNQLSSKILNSSHQKYAKVCLHATNDFYRNYLKQISKCRRQESILTNRLNGPLESDDEESLSSSHKAEEHTEPQSRPAPILVSRRRDASHQHQHRQTRKTSSLVILPHKESLSVQFPPSPPSPPSPLPAALPSVQPDKSSGKKGQKGQKQKGKRKNSQEAALDHLFDRQRYEEELCLLGGKPIEGLASSAAPPSTNHSQASQSRAPSLAWREHTLLMDQSQAAENDTKLARLALLACSLEGKYCELASLKEVNTNLTLTLTAMDGS